MVLFVLLSLRHVGAFAVLDFVVCFLPSEVPHLSYPSLQVFTSIKRTAVGSASRDALYCLVLRRLGVLTHHAVWLRPGDSEFLLPISPYYCCGNEAKNERLLSQQLCFRSAPPYSCSVVARDKFIPQRGEGGGNGRLYSSTLLRVRMLLDWYGWMTRVYHRGKLIC